MNGLIATLLIATASLASPAMASGWQCSDCALVQTAPGVTQWRYQTFFNGNLIDTFGYWDDPAECRLSHDRDIDCNLGSQGSRWQCGACALVDTAPGVRQWSYQTFFNGSVADTFGYWDDPAECQLAHDRDVDCQ